MQSNQKKIDYSKGMIYKLCCLDTNIKEVYIGSTTNFDQRKKNHGYNCNNSNNKKYNFNVYRFIRANGGWSNWTMTLIDYHPCTTKLELERGERAVLEQHEATLNKQVPSRGKKEYRKEYDKEYRKANSNKIKEHKKEHYKANKDKMKEKQKEYRENNKQKIKEHAREKVKCTCGAEISRNCLPRHRKSIKHLNSTIQFNNDSD